MGGQEEEEDIVFQVAEGGGTAVQERHRLLLAEQGSQGEQEV